jgi:hypothetical protein
MHDFRKTDHYEITTMFYSLNFVVRSSTSYGTVPVPAWLPTAVAVPHS